MWNMKCPMSGCGWEITPLISLIGLKDNKYTTAEQEMIDSATTQHSLMVEHLQEEHDGKIGGR